MTRMVAAFVLGFLLCATFGIAQNWDIPREGSRAITRTNPFQLPDFPVVYPERSSRFGFGEAPPWTDRQVADRTNDLVRVQDRMDKADKQLWETTVFIYEELVRLSIYVNERNALQDEAIRDTSRHYPTD